ncbi:MAG: molybdenum cofactor guanylyltransferase [Pseudomonadota bacterium]
MSVLGAVIAGGSSTRMGSVDKLALDWGGENLVTHIARRLQTQFENIVINMPGSKAALAPLKVPIVPDSANRRGEPVGASLLGPLAGIEAVLIHAKKAGFHTVVTCAGDTPFFPKDLRACFPTSVASLQMLRSEGGPQPLFASWPTSCLTDLTNFLKAEDTLKVTAFAEQQGVRWIDYKSPANANAFLNINTHEDLVIAQAHLAGNHG